MKQTGAPWLIAILALFAAISPISRGTDLAGKDETQNTADGSGTTLSSSKPSEDAARWKDPLQPFQDFFAVTPPEQAPSEPLTIVPFSPKKAGVDQDYRIVQRAAAADKPITIPEVVKEAASDDRKLEFLIALVPDPVESTSSLAFDQAIDAIQRAYSTADYLQDRFWLPWKPADKLLYRRVPGILLFRKDTPQDRRLAAVLLVGETPKIGAQKVALSEAILMVRQFMGALGDRSPVHILGPTFSGSAESLHRVFSTLHLLPVGTEIHPWDPISSSYYRMVTGSATAQGLGEILGPEPAFRRTVVSDDVLQDKGFDFLRDKLGWDLDEVALLTEGDTVYGRENARNLERITFPSGLANIRNEWEKNPASKGSAGPLEVPKTTLNLALGQGSQPVDLVPEFSPLTLRSKDLAIANILATISRSRIRYVGILATDTRDKLFLAKRIREFSPDVVLFTFDNNLLYAHPEYAESMDGMLVLTSFPLVTEEQRWSSVLGGPLGKYRRQFASELEQGIFQATQELIGVQGPKVPPAPRIWISAVGNGSLWPIAALPASGETPPFKMDEKETLDWTADLQLVFFALGLGGLAWWLWQVARPLDLKTETRGVHRITLGLLLLGWGVLWVAGGALLIIRALPVSENPWGHAALLSGLYVLVVWWATRSKSPLRPVLRGSKWPIVVLLILAVLPWLLRSLWMPGGAELFQLRARKFSSGLSPIVSLFFWTAAVYAWVFLEVKRHLDVARHFVVWPLRRPCEPPLMHCHTLARPLRQRLSEALPGKAFWIVLGITVGFPVLVLMKTVQPIAETKNYGRVFILLVAFGVSLSAVSFYRFLAAWLALQKILVRINQTRLKQAFKRISPQVNWNPMKSFGWRMPPFDLLILSAAKLKELPPMSGWDEVDRWLEEAFEGARKGKLSAEIKARRKLNRAFSRACKVLASKGDHPAVADFLAIRLVAYIRHVFSHLRHCLTETLVSGLLLIIAVRTYAFEPKQFLSICLWMIMVSAIILTLVIFLEMDRNASLSAISGTTPGQVTFDRHFFANFLSYGLLPLLGLVISQFPQISRVIVGWMNPLLHIVGGG